MINMKDIWNKMIDVVDDDLTRIDMMESTED